jgi:hypothetical protein
MRALLSLCSIIFGISVPMSQNQPVDVCSAMQADPYWLNRISTALDGLKMGEVSSWSMKALYWNGDGVSIAVLKTVNGSELSAADPNLVGAYLTMVQYAFSQPELISLAENKDPRVTLVLLDYLRTRVKDPQLLDRIEQLRSGVQQPSGTGKLVYGAQPLSHSCMGLTGPDPYSFISIRRGLRDVEELGSGAKLDERLVSLGDGASIGMLKSADLKEITDPDLKFVSAYLSIVRYAFFEPELISLDENKDPGLTLFLLDYLHEKVTDEELQRQIDSTREYVLKQAGSPRQSPFPEPSQRAK